MTPDSGSTHEQARLSRHIPRCTAALITWNHVRGKWSYSLNPSSPTYSNRLDFMSCAGLALKRLAADMSEIIHKCVSFPAFSFLAPTGLTGLKHTHTRPRHRHTRLHTHTQTHGQLYTVYPELCAHTHSHRITSDVTVHLCTDTSKLMMLICRLSHLWLTCCN